MHGVLYLSKVDSSHLSSWQCEARKTKLVASHDFQRFLSTYRDLTGWVSSMQALVSSDELAKDVGSAETLLERHQEYRTEIEARMAAFNAFESFGGQLLAHNHFASGDIQEKLDSLRQERDVMER